MEGPWPRATDHWHQTHHSGIHARHAGGDRRGVVEESGEAGILEAAQREHVRFLFDLAQLTGVYRILSFLGLGVALVLVSLLYQRFVVQKEAR